MKRFFCLLLILILAAQSAFAETTILKSEANYSSSKSFSVSGDARVYSMKYNGKSSLGTLCVDATVLLEDEMNDVSALVVESGTSVPFSYIDLTLNSETKEKDHSWYIASDSAKSIESYDFGSSIKYGGIIVQKSSDASAWTTAYRGTDMFENCGGNVKNFYTASRSDLNNGCYYRVVIAYKTARKTRDQKFVFIDTSEYEETWQVETYVIYLVADDEYEDTVAYDEISESVGDADNSAIGGTESALQSSVNQSEAVSTFNQGDGGHAFAAEAANVQSHAESGENVVHTGANNAKNGADYVITTADGEVIEQIQCKYYGSASRTIGACFEDQQFRYYSDNGVPMTIEVPKDQYEAAVLLMKKRISAGQVPGVTDPAQAEEIVRPGSVTYQQAVNLTKAGTIESLVYDAKTGCVSSLTAFGISAAVQYAVDTWNGKSTEVALKNSIYTGLRMGGNAFVTSVLASQLTRTGLNSLLVPGSEAIVKVVGYKAAAVIANAGRVGLTPIYGAAAAKSAAKLLRGGVIVNTVSFLVFTVPDIVETFRGRISAKQLLKNAASTAGGLAGAAAGAAGGAALGTAVLPGIGTTVGGVLGGIAGGMGAAIGTDKVADLIAEDDADEMLDIITEEFQNLTEEYLLNQDEADQVSDQLQEVLDADVLKDMYSSNNRNSFARNKIEPLVTDVISKRETIVLPDEEAVTESLIETLEEINDMDLEQ